MKIGTRVMASPQHHPHLRGVTLTVVESLTPAGTTETFLRLADAGGKRYWVRAGEVMPAPAPKEKKTMTMTPSERLDAAAKARQARTPGLRYSDAVKAESLNLSQTSAAWLKEPREVGSSAGIEEEARPRAAELVRRGIPVDRAAQMAVSELLRSREVSLSTAKAQEAAGAKFDALVDARVKATGESYRDAYRAVQAVHPDLAAAR